MFDYTTDGIKCAQINEAVSQLYSIDRTLRKINRGLKVLILSGAVYLVYKRKDKIKEMIDAKGE